MELREKVIKGLECCTQPSIECNSNCPYTKAKRNVWMACYDVLMDDALALLKAQEAVEPILACGWYWCGGIGCRNSLTSALENDIPARKPNYCERCGRAVKWDGN